MNSKVEQVFSELEKDIKSKLVDPSKFNWSTKDLETGNRLTLEFIGTNERTYSFYLTVNGAECYKLSDFVRLAELEQEIFTKLPFIPEGYGSGNEQLEGCSYSVKIQDEYADRRKSETINYSRRFLLECIAEG